MVALVPVAVQVGGDSPSDRVVVAGAQVGEQLWVEVIVVLGRGLLDRGWPRAGR